MTNTIALAARMTLTGCLLGLAAIAVAADSAPIRDAHAGLAVSQAWARATPIGATVGAAYFTVENRGKAADTLLSVSSAVATRTELHRSTVENGMSKMRPAGEITFAPGQSVKAEPGGLHVMLVGLKQPLKAGTRLPLVLHFRDAGAVTVNVDVQAATAAAH